MDPTKSLTNTLIILTLLLSVTIGIVAGGGLTFIRNALTGVAGQPEAGSTEQVTLLVTSTTVALPTPTVVLPSATPRPTETAQPTRTATVEPSSTPSPTLSPTASPTATPSTTPTEVVESEPLLLTVTTSGRLNLRDAPGTDSVVIGSLPQGTEAVVVGRDEEGFWAEIEVRESGQRGWVSSFPPFVALSGDIEDVPVTEP